MKQIIDENGNIVQGFYRLDNGAIVVKDSTTMAKYTKQKQVFKNQTDKISNLEMRVEELRSLVEQILRERT